MPGSHLSPPQSLYAPAHSPKLPAGHHTAALVLRHWWKSLSSHAQGCGCQVTADCSHNQPVTSLRSFRTQRALRGSQCAFPLAATVSSGREVRATSPQTALRPSPQAPCTSLEQASPAPLKASGPALWSRYELKSDTAQPRTPSDGCLNRQEPWEGDAQVNRSIPFPLPSSADPQPRAGAGSASTIPECASRNNPARVP